jgi:cytochrome c553
MDIGAYFASNPTMLGDGRGETALAKNLFTRGDMNRNILPCQSCHGEGGKGRTLPTETRPSIGGQHKNYLREQLRNWRSGERCNSPNGVMKIIAKSLSDSEIEALALYISGM